MATDRIVPMFDDGWDRPVLIAEPDLADLTAAQLAEVVIDTHQIQQVAGCRMVQLAAAWADAHPRLHPERNRSGRPCPGADRGRVFGAESNPEVSEFCTVEFAALQATSTASASLMIADALDLRHRLPLIWQRVCAGEVNAARARRAAQATRTLTDTAAGLVDRGIVDHLATLPWNRFLLVLTALVMEADPKAAAERAKAADAARFVRAGQANPAGLKLLIAQANAGDVITFVAMVNRIADILAANGDSDPVDSRRSKAIGILAQPAYALHLLMTHRHQEHKTVAHAAEPSEEDSGPACMADSDAEDEDLTRLERRFTLAELTDSAGPESTVSAEDLAWAGRTHRTGDEYVYVNTANVAAYHDPAVQAGSAPPGLADEPVEKSWLPVDPSLVDEHRTVWLDNPCRIDYRRLRPTAMLYVHLTDQALTSTEGVARVAGVGPVTVEQIRRFLAGSTGVSNGAGGAGFQIRVLPVLDPADIAPVDSYEIPLRIRQAVLARNPADVYPYGTLTSQRMELDHTIPYVQMDAGGPPGQTSTDNLGPLDRTHHRDKTHGQGSLRQPAPWDLPVPISRRLGVSDHQRRHPQPRQRPICPTGLERCRCLDSYGMKGGPTAFGGSAGSASVADYPSARARSRLGGGLCDDGA